MTRGTTPTLKFVLPIECSTLSEAWVTIRQCENRTVINKTLSDMETEGRTLTVKFTQADTLLLDDDFPAETQVRVRTNDGSAFASKVFRIRVDTILREGEI